MASGLCVHCLSMSHTNMGQVHMAFRSYSHVYKRHTKCRANMKCGTRILHVASSIYMVC